MRAASRFVRLVLLTAVGSGCSEFAEGVPRAEIGPLVRTGTAALGALPQPEPDPDLRSIALGPDEVELRFEAAKLTGRHEGRFTRVAGRLDFSRERLADSRLVLDIETDSVETDTPKLTRHLKSPDFFDVETYPRARFSLQQLTPAEGPNRFVGAGQLELHGIRRTLKALPVQIRPIGKRLKAEARFVIDRKAFGIVYAGRPDDLIAPEVILDVTVDAPAELAAPK